MQKLKEHSATRICRKLTYAFWYFFLIVGALAPVSLLLAYLGKLPDVLNINMTFPLNTEKLSIAADTGYSEIAVGSARASMDLTFFAREFPMLFLKHALLGITAILIVLTVLYHLKNLLDAATADTVFSRQNIRRIKVIAIAIFILDPLRWIYFNLVTQPLFSEPQLSITISIPSLGYWFIGLLVYFLAVVFERGHEMYQELKLTV